MSASRRALAIAALSAVAAGGVIVAWWALRAAEAPRAVVPSGRAPRIDPDYADCTIPPNIAPLNFVVEEPGDRYQVRVGGGDGEEEDLIVAARGPEIRFPVGSWNAMLQRHRGRSVRLEIVVRGVDRTWRSFEPVRLHVAPEPIDPYLVYRRLGVLHNVFTHMGTYQRCLEGFDQRVILESGPETHRCVNCHAFPANRPTAMVLHVRGRGGAWMLVGREGRAEKVDTRTPASPIPASYPAWHPRGRLLAYSANHPRLLHHSAQINCDVLDYDSDLRVCDVATGALVGPPWIAEADFFETFPAWSPDGAHLYFCRAPRLWPPESLERKLLPAAFDRIRYDLCRVAYDARTGRWGHVETLVAAEQAGASATQPKISPDGRFLLFCLHQYGAFPVYQPSSDLWRIDLRTLKGEPLEVNSPLSESWHAWSSNGRWIVFASKRRDGLFGRLYFSHVDAEGRAGKPWLLPQEDPTVYRALLDNFNLPEFLTGPVPFGASLWNEALAGQAAALVDRPVAAPNELLDARAADRLAGLSGALGDRPDDPRPRVEWIAELLAAGRTTEAAEAIRDAVALAQRASDAPEAALDALAWILATDPREAIRDGESAWRLADRACQASGRNRPDRLATLAAGYAEAGLLPLAVQTALEGIERARQQNDQRLARRIENHLAFYRDGLPYRAAARDGLVEIAAPIDAPAAGGSAPPGQPRESCESRARLGRAQLSLP